MSFTPLETIAIAALFSLVSALAVRLLLSRSFVTCEVCTAERDKLCVERDRFNETLEYLKEGQKIQFKMLRAIVLHLDIPAAEKEKILNED